MYDTGPCEGCTKLKQIFSTFNFIRTFVTICITFQLLVNGESNMIKVRNIYIDILLQFLLTLSCFQKKTNLFALALLINVIQLGPEEFSEPCQTSRMECFTKII